jgi:hypothetical protein
MSNKLIFRKAKEMHYAIIKPGSKVNPSLQVDAIQSELMLSEEDMKYYLESLKKLRLIKFTDEKLDCIELTKVGLSTMI